MSDLYWHFLRLDRRLQYAPHTLVEAGGTYIAVGRLVLCENGMHASPRALDALEYAPGDIICRVRLDGEHLVGHDKLCARSRTVLWLADAGPLLHEFACLTAERALAQLAASGTTPDPESLAAIAAKRAWLRGEITSAALEAAREATWVAFTRTDDTATKNIFRAAIRASSWSAARIAARDTARASAWTAAWAAVRAAAGSAAGTAAWVAASAASQAKVWSDPGAMIGEEARAAARATTWASLNTELERILLTLRPPEGVPA